MEETGSKPHSLANMIRHGVGQFKISTKTVTPDLPYLRPDTKLNKIPHNFTLTQGGMGDYICWTIALQWLVKEAPWIEGNIFAPGYFIEFARYFFDDVPGWKVYHIDDFQKYAPQGSLIRGPTDQNPQFINAVGASLVDIGFAYFANLAPAPEGVKYPVLDLSDSYLPREVRAMKGKYAVFTPGGTTFARTLRGRHINPLVEDALSRGLTPIFLGKHQLADVHRSYYADDVDFTKGLDLREKTSLLEAAAIMKYAAYTLGLDNGLLHLASCTDASVIFGYNIAHPSQRRPFRHSGMLEEIILTNKDLACIHCQTNVKLLCYHNFRNCLYEEQDQREAKEQGIEWSPKCIDKIFENNGERWLPAIERILSARKTNQDIREFRESLENIPRSLPDAAA